MTHIVTVEPGQSNIVASGPQFGVKYTLTGPDASRATFNDPTDMDYVGWLSDISGLDSPELREAADDHIGDDGGIHGDFFHGRRPVVLEGMVDSRPTNADRNIRMTKLQRVTNALRKDLTMRWAPEGGNEQILYMRRQQPLRITGGYNKSFQVALVSADYRIYGAAIREQYHAPNDSTVELENAGTTVTPPIFTIYGPATAMQVHNRKTGEYFNFASGYSISAGEYIVIDVANKSIVKNGTTDIYENLVFDTSTWWGIRPGVSNIEFLATGTTVATAMIVRWQDAWV